MEQPRLRHLLCLNIALLAAFASVAAAASTSTTAVDPGAPLASPPAPMLVAVNGTTSGVLSSSGDAFALLQESDLPATTVTERARRLVAVLPEPASLLLLAAGLLALFVLRERDMSGGRKRRRGASSRRGHR